MSTQKYLTGEIHGAILAELAARQVVGQLVAQTEALVSLLEEWRVALRTFSDCAAGWRKNPTRTAYQMRDAYTYLAGLVSDVQRSNLDWTCQLAIGSQVLANCKPVDDPDETPDQKGGDR